MTPLWSALAAPFSNPGSRTYWPLLSLTAAALVVLALMRHRGATKTLAALKHPSSLLDVQLLFGRALLKGLGWLPELLSTLWLARYAVGVLDGWYRPTLEAPSWLIVSLYTVSLFIVWDASRYVVHRAMHEVPLFWRFHQVHHSAEVLTPLTFHRLHPFETFVYGIRRALSTAAVTSVFFWLFRGQAVQAELLGVHAVGFVLNAVFGNLRHSHVWWTFGRWESIAISPAQHQLHHAFEAERCNYGTWLSIWDRLGGTLVYATEEPERFGLDRPNHDHDLLSAWLGPFRTSPSES